IGLHLGQRNRWCGEAASGIVDAVERVLPALVDQSAVSCATIFDESVAVEVAVGVDPAQRPVGGGQQGRQLGLGQSPAVQLAEQRNEQWGGIRRPVIGV